MVPFTNDLYCPYLDAMQERSKAYHKAGGGKKAFWVGVLLWVRGGGGNQYFGRDIAYESNK